MKKTIFVLCALACLVQAAFSQKVEVKDVISKHLASVVSPNRKVELANLTAVGGAGFTQPGNRQRQYDGKVVLASDGRKLAFAMTFPLDAYNVEQIVFDSKKLNVAFVRPGARSALGDYLFRNEEIVKEGLFGGVLSTVWTFRNPNEKKGSLGFEGTKKLDGREAYVISYTSKGGSGMSIKMFFDVETGRHVRSQYRHVMSAVQGPTPETSAGQSDTIEEMVEQFSDFKTENGITLPRIYTIRYSVTQGAIAREYLYALTFDTFYYDQKLDPATFEFHTKY